MTKSKKLTNRSKRLAGRQGLGLSESVLKLFPKTSRMGKTEPTQWRMAESRKVRVSERALVGGEVNDYHYSN